MHAIYLLTELNSVDSLPVILNFLKSNPNILETYFSFIIAEIYEPIVVLGKDKLPLLAAFLREPGIYLFSKTVVLTGLLEIAHNYQDKKEAIDKLFIELLTFFENTDIEPNILDAELVAFSLTNAVNLGLAEQTVDIYEKLFKMNRVSKSYAGDWPEFKENLIGKDQNYNIEEPREILVIKEKFKLFFKEFLAEEDHNYSEDIHDAIAYENYNEIMFSDSNLLDNKPTKTNAKKINRNDPCICGSGKNIKNVV